MTKFPLKKPIIYILTAICWNLTIPYNVIAQVDIIETVYLETDQGLNSRVNTSVTRDSKGYFYFFSRNSIQRYDGENFENVNISKLIAGKINLFDLKDIYPLEDKILLEFSKEDFFAISPGGLELTLHSAYSTTKPSRVNNTTTPSETLSISVNNKSYLWGINQVTIEDAKGNQKTIPLPYEITPKFLRSDRQGNIIAAYSNRVNYIDHYYVLDTTGVIHDFTDMAAQYPTALDLYTDNAFYKWMICGYSGVNVVVLKRPGVEFLLHNKSIRQDQLGKIITAFADIDGEVIISDENGNFSQYSPANNSLKEDIQSFPFVSSMLGRLQFDNNSNKLVIHGRDNNSVSDLYYLDLDSGDMAHHQIESFSRDFWLHENGHILLAGKKNDKVGRLILYNPETKKSTFVNEDLPPLNSITYDEDKKHIYLGTTQGMYVLNDTYDIITKYDKNESSARLLPYEEITFVQQYNEHLVLCSRGGGIYIVDQTKQQIVKNYNNSNGLTDNSVVAAVVDDDNRCWLATFNGINVLDSTFQIVKKIYEFDGLPDKELNTHSATKINGDLYFGTINGAVKINPEQVMDWDYSYRISLEKATSVDDGRISEIDIDAPAIELTDADSIIISYTITDYYKYPYHEPLVDVRSSDSEIVVNRLKDAFSISNFSKGRLDLQMILDKTNYTGKLGLDITPNYRWIRRLVLTLLSIVLFSALIIYYYTQYIRRVEQQKTDQNKKISELQLKALQGQMNPHFIFNALGAIQYFIQTNDVNKADEYLSDFALLMRGILDSSSKKYITLKEELKLIKLYVGLEKARFENKFDVNISVIGSVDEETLIPPMVIQPYIENAVNHGLHHLKKRKGQLNIDIHHSGDLLMIVIQDNGIGRKAAQALKNRSTHKSRGMGITAERIITINTSSDLSITIDIKDLVNSAGVALGTKVTIKIRD